MQAVPGRQNSRTSVMTNPRNIQSMNELLHYAKLDDTHSFGVPQTVFEVTDAIASELCTPGSRVIFSIKDEPKSNGTGRAFACTKEQTFSVVEAETSNVLLFACNFWLPLSTPLISESSDVAFTTINAMKHSYYELHECIAPSLKVLKQFLLPSTYHGPIEEPSDSEVDESVEKGITHFTREELGAQFPCSERQLIRAMARLGACEFNNAVRLIEPEYLNTVIRDIFSCADENGWNWRTQGLPYERVLEYLQTSHDRTLLEQIIRIFFCRRKSLGSFSADDLKIFPRNSKVCQLVAECLLSVTSSFDLTDFLAVWKASVPEGFRPKLRRHLTCAGRAFCRSSSIPTISNPSNTSKPSPATNTSQYRSISLLRSEDLPDESVESRLSLLFQRCPLWPEAELAGYLTEIIVLPNQMDVHTVRAGTVSTQVPCISSDSESDFEYADDVDIDQQDASSNSDEPSPVPAAVGAALHRYCRVTTTKLGRFYTEKHGIA
ncbi:unnamed protein product [Calicophoron daubneyi]|uniref:Sister chromatid cohesion protein DCC1 n=1 Tax=Calicophoron daubneyi TaxID=300641 RepID=A0AAV2TND6_CALDB